MMRHARGASGHVDRAAVGRQPAQAHAEAAAADALPQERIRALLNERARALARPVQQPVEPADTITVVTFALGAERYAIGTQYVREVVHLRQCSPVPGAPQFVLGVTNLRGEVLCLIDLRRLVGVPATSPTDRSRVVVLGIEREEFGILVDEVFEIARVRHADIVPLPKPTSQGRELLVGATREALVVLDGAALLGDPRLYVTRDRSSPAA